jgi:hypothetical protein
LWKTKEIEELGSRRITHVSAQDGDLRVVTDLDSEGGDMYWLILSRPPKNAKDPVQTEIFKTVVGVL